MTTDTLHEEDTPNLNDVKYVFDDLLNIKTKGNAFLAIYDPFNDSVIMQYAKGRGKDLVDHINGSVLNIPGGNTDSMRKHLMFSTSAGNKYFYQNVPYGKITYLCNKDQPSPIDVNQYENVIAAAIREFYEETGLFVYFTDDIKNINADDFKSGEKINGKTVLNIPHIYYGKDKLGKMRNISKKESFYPIKFICYYAFISDGKPTYVIYARLELPLPIEKINNMPDDDNETFAVFNLSREILLRSKLAYVAAIDKAAYSLDYIDYHEYKKNNNTTNMRNYPIRKWGTISYHLLLLFLSKS
jgi:hypothetical protein